MHTFKPGDELGKPKFTPKDSYDHTYLENKDYIVVRVKEDGKVVLRGEQNGYTNEHDASDLTPKSEVFKVRVVSQGTASMWYGNLIGQEFEVKDWSLQWYKIVDDKEERIIYKSDCIVVTDQKFNINDPVLSDDGRKGIVKDYYSEGKVPVGVKWQDGSESWCTEEMLSLDQPTSLPFTEELFNQGKYEVYAGSTLITDAHIYNDHMWGCDEHGCVGSWPYYLLTLKEKEVVVYFNIDSTGATGAKFKSIQECKDNKDSIDLAILSFNLTTRTVEKVWDYLTDKK